MVLILYKLESIVFSGNTGTVEYSVDPSVYDGGLESIDITLTESILAKLNSLSNEVKLIKLNFNNYYTKDETYNRNQIDNMFDNVDTDVSGLRTDLDILTNDVEIIEDRVTDLEIDNATNIDDIGKLETDVHELELSKAEKMN